MIQRVFGFDSDYLIIALLVLFLIIVLLLVVCLIHIIRLKEKYKIFMRGKNARSLEKTLIERVKMVDELEVSHAENKELLEQLQQKMQFTIHKIGLLKYDALDQMGGKLSFSVALLNQKDDGFVLSAMHSKEGCYTYIKDIIGGNSIMKLSEEEKKALEMAKENK